MPDLRDEFEALMPEPAAHRYWSKGHSSRWQLAGRSLPPDAEPLYTADQLRAAMQSVAERAAMKCEGMNGVALRLQNSVNWMLYGKHTGPLVSTADYLKLLEWLGAAAIRAREGKGGAG